MAEFVEFRAEEWIAELEHMERISLFERKEVKTIASKRKELEYKIQRRTKCKEDFLKYIQFEIDLYRIVKARREKTGITIKKSEIDYSLTHRIANLFKQAIFKFQDDVKLWMSFFKFCEGVKFHSLVSQMLVRMLQIHSNKPELWAFAAKWEAEQCKSVRNARQFLTRGLRHHSSCEMLYEELFKLELDFVQEKVKEVEKMKKKDENWVPDEVTNSILGGKVAEVVYDSAIKTIPGVDFKMRLLNISKQKKAPKTLSNKIFEDMVKCHSNEELTWKAMAQRAYEGLEGEGEVVERPPLRDRIQRSVSVYEEAVRKLNTVKMWGLYVDHVLELNRNARHLPVFKAKLLRKAMEDALASGKISERHCLQWIDILRKEKNKSRTLSRVLREATIHHPESLPLWYAHLRFHLSRDHEETATEVFRDAVGRFQDAVALWKLMAKYMILKSSPKTKELLKEGIEQGGEVALSLKPLYLQWLAQTEGMPAARKAFHSPQMNLPPCLELYRKMAALEAGQTPLETENIRKCHELAVTNFGKENADVWLEYVKFELREGDATRVPQIHRRALKSLNAEKVDEFVPEFNKIKHFQLRTDEEKYKEIGKCEVRTD